MPRVDILAEVAAGDPEVVLIERHTATARSRPRDPADPSPLSRALSRSALDSDRLSRCGRVRCLCPISRRDSTPVPHLGFRQGPRLVLTAPIRVAVRVGGSRLRPSHRPWPAVGCRV